MNNFATFMKALAERRQIRRSFEGALVTYRLKLEGTASLTIITNEINPIATARVMSEAWPAPDSEFAHASFMKEALNFNRNALQHLHCGVMLAPGAKNQYRLIWEVPSVALPDDAWLAQLKLFGRLTNKAWDTLPQPGSRLRQKSVASDDQHVIFMP
jgi:hypothetical protein